MSTISFKGEPVNTVGSLPTVGTPAPEFTLTKTDLSELSLKDFLGKRIILNIFPSLDTPICAKSVRRFNQAAGKLKNVIVICVSEDLPFAQGRFCGVENLNAVLPASAFRHPEFGKDYGVAIADGRLAGLLSRAIVIIDKHGKVIYTQQVPELSQEPDYQAALKAIES